MIPEVSSYSRSAEYGWISRGTRATLLACLFYSPLWSYTALHLSYHLAEPHAPINLKLYFLTLFTVGASKQCYLNLISNVMWVILPPKKIPQYSICLESMS